MAGSRPKRSRGPASLLGSSPRDPNSCPFEDFLQYFDSSLSRNVFLRLPESIVTKMKVTLARFKDDQTVTTDIVERIVTAIDAFQEACNELHPSAFVAIVRILIHGNDSLLRERGLYLLSEFLHNANKKEDATEDIEKTLYDIGTECLELIFVTFCDKSESYKTRRWLGLLILELTYQCQDNLEVIGFMPEGKRRKLGAQVLFEANEIMRTISGRVLTTFIASNAITKDSLFPEQTEKGLIAQYPLEGPLDSQWDTRFSDYLDNVWDEIKGTENHGTVDFAQNLVTLPEYLHTKATSIYHRSIYLAFDDCVYIYIHSESEGFDTAIDIPFHLILDIQVEPTPLDQSVGDKSPADLILHIKNTGGDQAHVNSSPSELSIVQLTFENMAFAKGISKSIQSHRAKHNKARGQGATGNNARASGHHELSESTNQASSIKVSRNDEEFSLESNHKAKFTKQTKSVKFSQSDEGLVLDENRKSKSTMQATFDDPQSEDELIPVGHYTDANEKSTKQTNFRKVSQSDEGMVLGDHLKSKSTKQTSFAEDSQSDDEDLILYGKSTGTGNKTIKQTKQTRFAEDSQSDDEDLILYGKSTGTGNKTIKQTNPRKVSQSDQELVLPIKKSQPILAKASEIQEQVEARAVRKPSKSLHQSPKKMNTRSKFNEVSGMTIDTSDELGELSPHVHRSAQMTFPNNPVDDTLPPTQHDESIDELSQMPPVTARSKRKPALKSKKPLGSSKKSDEKGSTTSKLMKQLPLAEDHITSENQDTGDIDFALEEVSKNGSGNTNKDWDIEADSPRLTALPLKKPVRTGKGAPKKRNRELNAPDRKTRGYKLNAMPVDEAANDTADDRPGPSNRANKPSSTKVAKTEEVDEKENATTTPAVIAKLKNAKKKPLIRQKAAQQVKESVSNDTDMHHADTGGQHVESDTLDPQQHENFFEEAFHEHELPIINDELSFTPEPSVFAARRFAGKIADAFNLGSESPEPQCKVQVYGRGAKRETPAPQKQSKSKRKGNLKGKEKEEIDLSPPVDPSPEQPAEQKRSLATTGKPPATTARKEIELICISSDEESEDDSGDMEPHQPQAIAHAATMKLGKNTTSATAGQTESSAPPLLEAPSDLSPEDQSTPAMSYIPPPAIPAPVAPTKLRNPVDATDLVDDHLSRKTPIVAFGKKGPKNQGLHSAVKLKPTGDLGSKTDIAKLVNTVALGPSRKRPSPEHTPHFEATLTKRAKKAEVAMGTAADDGAHNVHVQNMPAHRSKSSSPFDTLQDSLLCSSQSRVDENGSPHARPTAIEETVNVAQIRRRSLSMPEKMPRISQSKDIMTERGSFDEPDDDMPLAFDDEPTAVNHFGNQSPNQKLQFVGKEKETTIKPRYFSSRPSTAGKNAKVIPETDHVSTVNSVNPFEEKQPRQLSNFAKRLKGEQPSRPKFTIITRPQPKPLLKAPNDQPRKRSFVFEHEPTVSDPEKTLVEPENQYPRKRARSASVSSSGSSSDASDDKASVAESEEEVLSPEMAWRKSLKPHYKNMTDTLICMVQTLVGDLVDKETAIDDIVDEYTRNGTKHVEEFERKASADRRELESQFSNTLQSVTRSFEKTRDVAIATNLKWENIDEVEGQWRERQHELQKFMTERIEAVKNGTWMDLIKK